MAYIFRIVCAHFQQHQTALKNLTNLTMQTVPVCVRSPVRSYIQMEHRLTDTTCTPSALLINPWHACAARVTVLVLYACLSVCLFVPTLANASHSDRLICTALVHSLLKSVYLAFRSTAIWLPGFPLAQKLGGVTSQSMHCSC